ncbi:MAG: sel1 repeat family protein, partial [Emcibacteraceae bacterium]|nr:sel1 repeat family protein [Emcibacteraceae bacterium]
DHLSKANNTVILSSNATSEQLFKFNRCRSGKEDEEAQYRLGANYEEGVGTDQNLDAAVRWYKEAGRHKSGLKWRYGSEIATNVGPETPGHPIAQYRLGMMYLDGRGVKQSEVMAKLWIGRAAEQGYELAVDKEREYLKENIK